MRLRPFSIPSTKDNRAPASFVRRQCRNQRQNNAMIAGGRLIVKNTRPGLLAARSSEIPAPRTSIQHGTSGRPLDAARFVRYLLAAQPWAVTHVGQQPDGSEEVVQMRKLM